MLSNYCSDVPEEAGGRDGLTEADPAGMTDYLPPRFAINPLSTERGVAGGSPAVTFHALTCRLVRHDARYFTAVVEVEEWIEATPWALVPCILCNPRQEMS